MKKKLVIGFICVTLALTGCGSSSYSERGYSNGAGFSMPTAPASDFYYDNEDMSYSSTNINGDKVDYSYTFSASGETRATKESILKDYENIQTLVESKDGFIENVYNEYNIFDSNDNYYSHDYIHYKAIGQLSFTIEINNDSVEEIVAELEKIATNNNLTVNTYAQSIQNYKAYRIGNEDDYDYNVITEEELLDRLAYADISVQLSYQVPRNAFAVCALSIREIIHDFFDGLEDIIKVILILLIVIVAIFFEIVLLYKWFKKINYKYSKKHPEYYLTKKVELQSKESEENDSSRNQKVN